LSPPEPRRILALGGGGFTAGQQDAGLDDLVLELSPRREPRICFLPTASGDPEAQVAHFHEAYGDRPCRPSVLSLFRRADDPVPLAERLLSQDVIYVGGGSMRNLLAIWRAHQLDALLPACWRRGVALAGLSAGAMCWFAHGITTSHGRPQPAEGLGFLRGSMSVHWSTQQRRREVYRGAIANGMPAGYGVDDGAALVFAGTRLIEVVAARDDADAYSVQLVDGEVLETPLPARRLEPVERRVRERTPLAIAELREVRDIRARQRLGGGR
jgi:dipeptidase E